jgi:hypothetical protein
VLKPQVSTPKPHFLSFPKFSVDEFEHFYSGKVVISERKEDYQI